ncbi:MAG: TIGR01777 family protein [Caldilineaceae bacterium]|nr:TIGR01777 family protein [Caldilineaceae bacterium]
MRIIITGGAGTIGRPLSAALAADGHEVSVLSRNPIEAQSMPDGVYVHRWDAETSEGWGELADGADAIINLAGAGLADKRWSDARKKLIRSSRIKAGKAVMEAIRNAGQKPKVLIQGSAVGYYGTSESAQPITEEHAAGNDFLAKLCSDWELSTAPAEHMGVRRPIIRTGIVLTNAGGAFPRLKLPFKFFVGGKLGDGEQWMPWIHIDDEVRAIQFLLENEDAAGPFNLAAPDPVRNHTMADALGESMHRPAFLPAPAFALKALLGEMSTVVLDGQKAVPAKLEGMGFEFTYPHIAAALDELAAEE